MFIEKYNNENVITNYHCIFIRIDSFKQDI